MFQQHTYIPSINFYSHNNFICELTVSRNRINVACKFIDVESKLNFCDGDQDCENTDLVERDCPEGDDYETITLPYSDSGKRVKASIVCNRIYE
jgi:hypothetical protein